jgi:hypothetical protein
MVSIGLAKKTCLDLGVSTTRVLWYRIWSPKTLGGMIMLIKVTSTPTPIFIIINGMGWE